MMLCIESNKDKFRIKREDGNRGHFLENQYTR